MIVPLAVLAVLSVVGGFVGMPMQEGGHAFARWLAPVFAHGGEHATTHHVSAQTEWMLIAVSILAALLGIFFAFRAYLQQPSLATRLRERWAALYRVLLNKYWVDELYDAVAVRPIYAASVGLWRFWDEKIVDGAVNGVGYTFEGLSSILRLFQTGFVGTYALFFALGVFVLLLFVNAKP
jgi:NADH-quinone oxidoreductase subunit L